MSKNQVSGIAGHYRKIKNREHLGLFISISLILGLLIGVASVFSNDPILGIDMKPFVYSYGIVVSSLYIMFFLFLAMYLGNIKVVIYNKLVAIFFTYFLVPKILSVGLYILPSFITRGYGVNQFSYWLNEQLIFYIGNFSPIIGVTTLSVVSWSMLLLFLIYYKGWFSYWLSLCNACNINRTNLKLTQLYVDGSIFNKLNEAVDASPPKKKVVKSFTFGLSSFTKFKVKVQNLIPANVVGNIFKQISSSISAKFISSGSSAKAISSGSSAKPKSDNTEPKTRYSNYSDYLADLIEGSEVEGNNESELTNNVELVELKPCVTTLDLFNSYLKRNNKHHPDLLLGAELDGCTPFTIPLYPSGTTPHLLLAAPSGGGKTTTVHNLLTGLMLGYSPDVIKLNLIDVKASLTTIYNGVPHVYSSTSGIFKAARTLDNLKRNVYNKYRGVLKGKTGISVYNHDRLKEGKPILPFQIIVFDEYQVTSDLDSVLAQYGFTKGMKDLNSEQTKQKLQITRSVAKIRGLVEFFITTGREYGFIVILISQGVSKKLLGDSAKSQTRTVTFPLKPDEAATLSLTKENSKVKINQFYYNSQEDRSSHYGRVTYFNNDPDEIEAQSKSNKIHKYLVGRIKEIHGKGK